jgi:hypothetical protein
MTDRLTVYALTTLKEPVPWEVCSGPKTRTVGLFTTREGAEEAVVRNHGDLYEEGSYPYAVVESVVCDTVYPVLTEEGESTWFVWVDSGPPVTLPGRAHLPPLAQGGYQRCPCPERWANVCSWGIG